MNQMRCKSKLVLCGERDFFGPGTAKLLHLIDETGSIRQAAIQMDMSYSKAWKMLGKVEDETGIKFLDSTIGGKKGGKSTLTDDGRQFLTKYDEILEKIKAFSDELIRNF